MTYTTNLNAVNVIELIQNIQAAVLNKPIVHENDWWTTTGLSLWSLVRWDLRGLRSADEKADRVPTLEDFFMRLYINIWQTKDVIPSLCKCGKVFCSRLHFETVDYDKGKTSRSSMMSELM
jgi:hypothetical protein